MKTHQIIVPGDSERPERCASQIRQSLETHGTCVCTYADNPTAFSINETLPLKEFKRTNVEKGDIIILHRCLNGEDFKLPRKDSFRIVLSLHASKEEMLLDNISNSSSIALKGIKASLQAGKLDLILTENRAIKKLLENLGFSSERIRIAPMMPDRDLLDGVCRSVSTAERLRDGRTNIISFDIDHIDNAERLLRVFSSYSLHLDAASRLIVIGDLPIELLCEMMELSSQLGIEKRVFFTGKVNSDQLKTFLMNCHVCIETGSNEEFDPANILSARYDIPVLTLGAAGNHMPLKTSSVFVVETEPLKASVVLKLLAYDKKLRSKIISSQRSRFDYLMREGMDKAAYDLIFDDMGHADRKATNKDMPVISYCPDNGNAIHIRKSEENESYSGSFSKLLTDEIAKAKDMQQKMGFFENGLGFKTKKHTFQYYPYKVYKEHGRIRKSILLKGKGFSALTKKLLMFGAEEFFEQQQAFNQSLSETLIKGSNFVSQTSGLWSVSRFQMESFPDCVYSYEGTKERIDELLGIIKEGSAVFFWPKGAYASYEMSKHLKSVAAVSLRDLDIRLCQGKGICSVLSSPLSELYKHGVSFSHIVFETTGFLNDSELGNVFSWFLKHGRPKRRVLIIGFESETDPVCFEPAYRSCRDSELIISLIRGAGLKPVFKGDFFISVE